MRLYTGKICIKYIPYFDVGYNVVYKVQYLTNIAFMGANEMSTRRCYVPRYYDHSKLLQRSCANSFIPIRFDNIELVKKCYVCRRHQ